MYCFLWGTNWIYICCVEESRPSLWSSGQSSWLYNGDVLCFLWGTNWIYICYVEESRPPLWSSEHSSWLQIQRSGFCSQRYQIFREAVGLERGPLILVSTIEELLGRKSSCSGLENREYCRRDPLRRPRGALYSQNVDTNFTDKLRSQGRYSSLAESRYKVRVSVLRPVQYLTHRIRKLHTTDRRTIATSGCTCQ
jgi:hypothetical protein